MQEQLRKNPNTAFVLWTCRVEDKLDDAKRFIKEHDLPIFYFNENHPSVFTWMEGAKHTRKIYANEYWDDRAVKVGQYQEFGGKQ
jgi:hypothetical protein